MRFLIVEEHDRLNRLADSPRTRSAKKRGIALRSLHISAWVACQILRHRSKIPGVDCPKKNGEFGMKWSLQRPWCGFVLAFGGLMWWTFGAEGPGGHGTGRPALRLAEVEAQEIAAGLGGDLEDQSGVFLPTDRLRERQLDQARQAIAAGVYSDASTVIDDILASGSDSFLRPGGGAATWTSVKAEARALLDGIPAAGRDAYELQFRAKADRQLQMAIESDDREAVIAVARRWFHTPAGRSAAVMTALDCLAGGQPLSALAWLDRLANEDDAVRFEPSLTMMRAVAARDAGDRETAEALVAEAVRKAGGERLLLGGKPAHELFADQRVTDAVNLSFSRPMPGRPLLVPRFRVPLTRHPGEARLLHKQRLAARDRQQPLFPAGQALVVGETAVLRSPLGLLGVDLTTGKRIWLQPGRFDSDSVGASTGEAGGSSGNQSAVARGYEDLTTGTLATNGRLLFAVESPDSAIPAADEARVVRPFGFSGSLFTGNALSAYDPAEKGQLVWRLPRGLDRKNADSEQGRRGGQQADTARPWFLGPPLPVGNELYVLVEELGEIRLDVLEAGSGDRLWSQPLVELDESRRIEQSGSRGRRLAGLRPTLQEGVLVCPTGAGGVVGLDIATRTLLWAYRYVAEVRENVTRLPNGMIIRRGGLIEESEAEDRRRWLDSTPVAAGGRVFLTPSESDELHCLDIRTGSLLWSVPRADGLLIAGVDDQRLIVLGSQGVVAYTADDGSPAWPARFLFAELHNGAMPSGRGLMGGGRLLLPVDTPAVLEINLRDGSLSGVSAGRDSVPGNLVASGGEMLSQSIDSLDVFFLVESLQMAVNDASGAATATAPLRQLLEGGLVDYWKGQLLIDSGHPREGAELITAARAGDPDRVTQRMATAAVLQAMRFDFPATVSLFPKTLEECQDPVMAADLLRVGIDGFLTMGDPSAAWALWRQAAEQCLEGSLATRSPDAELETVPDGNDPFLASIPSRWLGGRLEAVLVQGSEEIAAEAEGFLAGRAEWALEQGPAEMALLLDLGAAHPVVMDVRRQFAEMLANPPPGQEDLSAGSQKDRLLQLELVRMLMDGRGMDEWSRPVDDPAWPLGRVNITATAPQGRRSETLALASVPISGQPGLSLMEGLRLKVDRRQPGMLLYDGFGRQLGGLLSYEGSSQPRQIVIQQGASTAAVSQPSIMGRILLVDFAGGTAAFELDLPKNDEDDVGLLQHRRLWSSGTQRSSAGLITQMLGTQGSSPLPHLGGSIPLGTRVSEPQIEDGTTPPKIRGARIMPNAAVCLESRTLTIRHPISGQVLWSRTTLPADSEILVDSSCVCVCGNDGGETRVYSMQDGRGLGVYELPPVSDWLETCGRRVLAVDRGRLGPFTGGTVQLQLIDPLLKTSVTFGPFSPEARVVPAGSARLALLEPSGRLTLLNLQSGKVEFEVTLDRMPPGFNQLVVRPWRDRFLVIASRPETSAESEQHRQLGAITGVRTAGVWDASQQFSPLITGAVWAVDRATGESLWPVPATVLHHGFDPEQPADLPVLVFARRITTPGATRQPQLSLLCLDKRTGSELLADDRITTEQHLFHGCEITASPENHTITLTHGTRDITLTFGGEATSPRPPYQGLSRPLRPPSLSDKIESWFERALDSLPLFP
jgi:hypothetical protein